MYNEAQKKWAKDFLEKCERKVYSVMDDIKFDYPEKTTADGKYDDSTYEFGWTCGFWGGMMWLLYMNTGDEKYKRRAIACSERLNGPLANPKDYSCINIHDTGFVYELTNTAHYKLLGDEDAKIRALHAATMLAGRFNLNGNYIRAWSWDGAMGYAIIDCLMNLPFLYWASEETKDVRFAAIAKAHAKTAVKEFIKEDGSVYHIVNFDQTNGKVIDYPFGQGYASGSSWSRGQSWAVYGFALSYKYTKDEEFLKASKGVADYIIENFGDFKLAPVDYMQPAEPRIYDASASAITASGMIELAGFLGEDGKKYSDFALKLLEGLYDDCDFTQKSQAIVQSATCLYHLNQYYTSYHHPLIYADFYLIEALMKIADGENLVSLW